LSIAANVSNCHSEQQRIISHISTWFTKRH